MSKLYVFGIGGTGSRVIKALTMLLASGVECKSTIVPVIIDPDQDAGDLTRATEYLKLYDNIHQKNKYSDDENSFFKTEIKRMLLNYRLPINDTVDVKFSEFMGIKTMSPVNKALCEALFSKKNLDSDMKVGFKGNPNIGSVVLNQFTDSVEFKNLADSFAQGDRIFIISSIFGGTGASGFPLLLKNLRSNDKINNHQLINSAKIGAVTVLPYFTLKSDDNSEIDSSTFISKTKSALQYYEKNISDNNSLNTLYYIGDKMTNTLTNCEGGKGQKNPAHFIELASALAVLDFERIKDDDFAHRTIHKEFGVRDEVTCMNFTNLSLATQRNIRNRMIQMHLMSKYLEKDFLAQINYQPWAKSRKIGKAFVDSEFYKNIKSFTEYFENWIAEMSVTQRGFAPFNLNKKADLFETVNGLSPNSSRFGNFALIDDKLNCQPDDKTSNEEQFLRIFNSATNEAVKSKFNE